MARWRLVPAWGPVAELEAYAERCERAGDWERAAAAWSWLVMLEEAGGDRAVADLFCEFAREERRG
jgi:hypothetical protein